MTAPLNAPIQLAYKWDRDSPWPGRMGLVDVLITKSDNLYTVTLSGNYRGPSVMNGIEAAATEVMHSLLLGVFPQEVEWRHNQDPVTFDWNHDRDEWEATNPRWHMKSLAS